MDYEHFKIEIYKMTGINLSFYKEKQMKRRIDSLIKKNRAEEYVDYLESLKKSKILFDEFINYLTINVSEFYRNPEQWRVLETEILPDLLMRGNNLRIWSSACSTGDEPYTLAMVLNKYLPLEKIRIIASDIDKEAIATAKEGIYSYKSIEKLPDEYLDKYFIKEGELLKVKNELKKCIEFTCLNLLSDLYPENCDLIICRNVLIYFTEEAKALVYYKMSRSLRKGGILFLGSTEQIIMPGRFGLASVRTFFYTKE